MSSRFVLIVRFLFEFSRYDLVSKLAGFRKVYAQLGPVRKASREYFDLKEFEAALNVATMIYPATVKCLQRSTVLARVLRQAGCSANLVVGYRMTPFAGHAWVEVDGRVVADSQSLPGLMLTLDRA